MLDALTTAPFEFKTLDGELYRITPDEIVSPSSMKVFKGKGMPILNNDPLSPLLPSASSGDFILQFEIIYPSNLSSTNKEELCKVLEEVECE